MDRKAALEMIASKSLPAELKPSIVFALLDVGPHIAAPGALEQWYGYTHEQAIEIAAYYNATVEPGCKATLRRKHGTSSTGRGRVENERG